jgi:hypothetical protein
MRHIVGTLAAAAATALAACAPKHIEEHPIMSMGDRVKGTDSAVSAAATQGGQTMAASKARADSILIAATASCAPENCAAIARGEAALGMSAIQIMAATRTTDAAWTARTSGPATILVANTLTAPPRDVGGEIAMVQLADGKATMLTYRSPQGIRVVRGPGDATAETRNRETSQALIREGDDMAAAGRYDEALDRYDRASVLGSREPELEYKIARVLDRQMRPIEALMRYQRFLNQLDIDRINAQGEANAKLSAAVIAARERIVVLEKQAR